GEPERTAQILRVDPAAGTTRRAARRPPGPSVSEVTDLVRALTTDLTKAADSNARLKSDLEAALAALRAAADESRDQRADAARLAADLESRASELRALRGDLDLLEAERDGALAQVARLSREGREEKARADVRDSLTVPRGWNAASGRRLAGRGCGGLSVDVGRDNSPTNSDCSPPSSLAHQSDNPAPHNRTGTLAGASRRPLIFHSLYFLWPGNGSGQRAPEEDPRIDVEVWALVFKLREQELPVAREEPVPVRRRETLLVLGEQRAAHPLHDLLTRLHQVGVHDHPDVLARVAEPVEPRCVAAGLEQRRAAHVPAEQPPELGRSG